MKNLIPQISISEYTTSINVKAFAVVYSKIQSLNNPHPTF